jgi:hypothetical protein
MADYLAALRTAGEPAGLDDRLIAFGEFNALFGLSDLLAREQRWRGEPTGPA